MVSTWRTLAKCSGAQAKSLGITAVTGLEMLVAQALYAVEFFLDTKLDPARIDEIYRKIAAEKK